MEFHENALIDNHQNLLRHDGKLYDISLVIGMHFNDSEMIQNLMKNLIH